MKIEKALSVAFSGHRTFKNISPDNDLFAGPGDRTPAAVSQRVRETVMALHGEGYRHFLCGMAEGFDLLAAEAVIELKRDLPELRLVAVIPFPGQAAGFDIRTRERYDGIVACCDDTVTICHSYGTDCFHRRNDHLIDHSDVLVCYFNGSKGGTAYTVRRALKARLRVINLWYR